MFHACFAADRVAPGESHEPAAPSRKKSAAAISVVAANANNARRKSSAKPGSAAHASAAHVAAAAANAATAGEAAETTAEANKAGRASHSHASAAAADGASPTSVDPANRYVVLDDASAPGSATAATASAAAVVLNVRDAQGADVQHAPTCGPAQAQMVMQTKISAPSVHQQGPSCARHRAGFDAN